MNQQLIRFISDLQGLLAAALTTQSEEGSGLGIFLRALLRKRKFSVRQTIGINLAGLAFFAGIIVPQTSEAVSSMEVSMTPVKNVIVVEAVPSIFQWPFDRFGISQEFSAYHPGMDLTNPLGTPIHAIGDGLVTWTKYIPYGYGYHVLVTHHDGVQSLYAHLDRINVREGAGVTKKTAIGEVGLTGWTSGSHLHFEIYQNGVPTNPYEVLPQVKEQ